MLDVETYKKHLIRKGCKPNTIKRRLWNLQNLLKHTEFEYKGVDDWLFSLIEKGYKAKYVNSIIDSVRTYANFIQRDEKLIHYPDFKEEATYKSTMSDEEIEGMLNLPCPERHCFSPKGLPFTRKIDEKNYYSQTVFFKLLAYTGCRPSEVARLHIDNVLWGQGCLSILNDKTGLNRLVPIAPNISEELKSYVANLPAIHHGYLFKANNATGFINSSTWCDSFHKRLNRLGIQRKGITVYSLRHSFITSMLENDVNIFKVQKIVGHRRLETTNIYTHMTTKDIKAAIKKLPLVQKNADPHIALASFKEAIRDLCIDKDDRFTYNLEESPEKIVLRIELK